MTKPKPPRGAQRAGKALWDAVLDEYELKEPELLLLREAVRTVDTLDALEARVAADGPLLGSSQGERAHPALGGGPPQRGARGGPPAGGGAPPAGDRPGPAAGGPAAARRRGGRGTGTPPAAPDGRAWRLPGW